MKKVIIISGTPGTGKTTIADELSRIISAKIIDINQEVLEHNYFSNDKARDTKIADIENLRFHLIRKIKLIDTDLIIIEGHYADIIPNNLVYKAIIIRTHPEILKKRLELKKFSPRKIAENIQAEILGDCIYHALENYDDNKVFEIDNSDLTIEKTVEKFIEIIKSAENIIDTQRVDWLGTLEKNGELSKYFD